MDDKVYRTAKTEIALRDNYRRMIEEHPDLPLVQQYAKGALDAHEIALGGIAGIAGFLTREAFELAVRLESEARAEAKHHQAGRRHDDAMMAFALRDQLPVEGAVESEPMGGWEPRS